MVAAFKSRTQTPTTVGVATVYSLSQVGASVDVLSFHSYHGSWESGVAVTETALAFARSFDKPVFNSETGCIARANAYDATVEMALRNGIGYALWELMVSDCVDCMDTRRWKHGLMYRDGTTRDAAGALALRGIFLNRGERVSIAVPRPNVEGRVSSVASAASAWLVHPARAAGGASTRLRTRTRITQVEVDPNYYMQGVAILDSIGNLAESSRTVPAAMPLSAAVRTLAAAGDSVATRAALRARLIEQVTPLQAVANGPETVPGVCVFPDSKNVPPQPCLASLGCTSVPSTDESVFSYDPPSTSVLGSCWTLVHDCPIVDTNGTLHYCNQNNAAATITLNNISGNNNNIGLWTDVVLAFKTGPDCGLVDVSVDDGPKRRYDTYSPVVTWTNTSVLPVMQLSPAAAGGKSHKIVLTVPGVHSGISSNSWVQLVEVQLWDRRV